MSLGNHLVRRFVGRVFVVNFLDEFNDFDSVIDSVHDGEPILHAFLSHYALVGTDRNTHYATGGGEGEGYEMCVKLGFKMSYIDVEKYQSDPTSGEGCTLC